MKLFYTLISFIGLISFSSCWNASQNGGDEANTPTDTIAYHSTTIHYFSSDCKDTLQPDACAMVAYTYPEFDFNTPSLALYKSQIDSFILGEGATTLSYREQAKLDVQALTENLEVPNAKHIKRCEVRYNQNQFLTLEFYEEVTDGSHAEPLVTYTTIDFEKPHPITVLEVFQTGLEQELQPFIDSVYLDEAYQFEVVGFGVLEDGIRFQLLRSDDRLILSQSMSYNQILPFVKDEAYKKRFEQLNKR